MQSLNFLRSKNPSMHTKYIHQVHHQRIPCVGLARLQWTHSLSVAHYAYQKRKERKVHRGNFPPQWCEKCHNSNSNISSQCVKRILNKTAKAINETFTWLNSCLRGSEYILFEISALRAWNSPARQPSRFGQHGQHRLSSLAGGFYALNVRISYKMYSEPLKHEFQSCEGLVDGFCSFI